MLTSIKYIINNDNHSRCKKCNGETKLTAHSVLVVVCANCGHRKELNKTELLNILGVCSER